MGHLSSAKCSSCNYEECQKYAYVLTTRWINNDSSESSVKFKAVADILRSKFDTGLFQTALLRNNYRGVFTFADFCYMFGEACDVKLRKDGRYEVILPGCSAEYVHSSYLELIENSEVLCEIKFTDTSMFSMSSSKKKEICPFNPDVINNLRKELPSEFESLPSAADLYLAEIGHG